LRRAVHANTMAMALRGGSASPRWPRTSSRPRTRPKARGGLRGGPSWWSTVLKAAGLPPERDHHQGGNLRTPSAGVACSGGSTERRPAPAWRSRARSASRLDIDDFDRVSPAPRRCLCDPQARRPGTFRRRPLQGGRRPGHAPSAWQEAARPAQRGARSTVTGETIGEAGQGGQRDRGPAPFVRGLEEPPEGHRRPWAILRGNPRAPRGCVIKLAGHERLHHEGPARVFRRRGRRPFGRRHHGPESSPATSSSSATRARPGGTGPCARCSR